MELPDNNITRQVWDYLLSKGYNKFGAAGLMGNLYSESGIQPNRLEQLCIIRLGRKYTSETYTQAVDNGSISAEQFLHPLPGKQYGYGLCQWTSPGRKSGLYTLVKQRGVSIADLQTQLDFMYKELSETYVSVHNTLKTAKSLKEASDIVLIKFESPADTGSGVKNTRASYGQQYYYMYAAGTGGSEVNNKRKYLDVLASWHGYRESNGTDDIIIKIYNAHRTESYCMSMSDPWCHATVSAAAYTAGCLDIIPNTSYCPNGINWFKNRGQWVGRYADNYDPQVADVIYYDWGSDAISDHVGVIIKRSGSTLTVREGNYHDALEDRTISMYSASIMGYGRPAWDSSSTVTAGNRNWLQIGDTGDRVKDTQVNLIILGFSCGTAGADGEYGAGTEKAVKEFQKHYNLVADGEAGELTLAKLNGLYSRKFVSIKNGIKGLQVLSDTLTVYEYPFAKSKVIGTLKKGNYLGCDKRCWSNGSPWVHYADGWVIATHLTGWIKESGKWWYLNDGYKYPVNTWQKIDGCWYLFGENGWMYSKTWRKVDGKFYYLTESGAMARNAWIKYKDHYCYVAKAGDWDKSKDSKAVPAGGKIVK